jgi:hypothetical protein
MTPPGCVIPGSEFLKGLLGVLVAFPGNRLREGALGGPGNGGRAGCRDSRAHTADLRCDAQEVHRGCQLAGDKLREYLWGLSGESGLTVRVRAVVLVVRVLVRF